MDEVEAMRMAIRLAYEGKPFVSPNPPVGCVILNKNNEPLGSGFHKKYGGPHAEIEALSGLAEEELNGAHVIVTLEPCAHEGKTPSCAKHLAKLPIRKVTFGLMDPNPLVAGQGAEILRQAGIEVVAFPDLQDELEELCEEFLFNHRQKQLFVALKVATSLDGQMAMRSGESQWITGDLAREHAHYLRACYDATLVGVGSVERDNPSLNVRHPAIKKTNKIVILDPEAKMLEHYDGLKMAQAHQPKDVYWCISEDIKVNPGLVQVLKIKMNENSFDIEDLKSKLWDQGLRSIMVEGGVHTLSEFLKAKAAQRLHVFVAPHIMGAAGAQSWTRFLELSTMSERIPLSKMHSEQVGDDLLITAKFQDQGLSK